MGLRALTGTVAVFVVLVAGADAHAAGSRACPGSAAVGDSPFGYFGLTVGDADCAVARRATATGRRRTAAYVPAVGPADRSATTRTAPCAAARRVVGRCASARARDRGGHR